ncbi:tRNA pseudouridine(55) synthase TruB [Streptomyces sp. SL13]|uniref:tRNA pseudouridine synthase B n=1 Tax=Streptantibioticus silvisoli TaxID=2705255 RepID=A0AA90KB61_9ACTN|nr:tRNA pseudouridine(55) synthase TruB [Streptantibioticus silvisoli]MDI5972897.1 tRNA pseudouridine(55) synthase TruB [Streptantibioticus silvisoli]
MKRKGVGPDGLVVVDKPAGLTSHQVVSRIRKLAGTRRVGHAGTLDPMATGVLIIGVEKATRLLGHLALTSKTYQATIRLGQTTVTDDAEGEITATASAAHVTRQALEAGVGTLTGDILQVPSKVSAIKVDGRRAHRLVRAEEEFELAARPVTVSGFTVHAVREAADPAGVALLDADVTVACSSGTYVRALARDLGAGLGTGGHLTALRRTRVGPYGLDDAVTLEALEESFDVLPINRAAAAAFPRWDVDGEQARQLINGVRQKAPGIGPGAIAVFGPDERFIALVEERRGETKILAGFV